METRLERQELLFGEDSTEILKKAHVAVFGIGGVGSYCVEALGRSGIGALTLVDKDVYSLSNMNRQLYATLDTLGKSKAEAAKERMGMISPDIKVYTKEMFFLPENGEEFDFTAYDYVVDAVDTVSAKLALIEACHKAGTPIISAMGAGNKQDPTGFTVTDIYKTDTCPLARAVRLGCKKRRIPHLKVVYSKELAHREIEKTDPETGKSVPGSTAFVPPVVGLILAGEVVKDLLKKGRAKPENQTV